MMNAEFETLVEKVYRGEADSEERVKLEMMMYKEPTLRREAVLLWGIMEGARQIGRNDMKQRLKLLHRQEQRRSRLKRRMRLGLGLVMALFVFALGFQYYYTPIRLFEAHYKPLPTKGLAVQKVVLSPQLEEALQAYEQKAYDKAVEEFKEAREAGSSIETLQLYEAISYIETGKPEKAKSILINFQSENTYYSETAQWYLALVLLREHRPQAARQILEHLAKGQHYTSVAQELLEALSE
jgi:tetratricopeptide (TPR) repeat protein